MIPVDFCGRAERLADYDLPRAGAILGVGEDEIHAILDVETRGGGYDGRKRPLILFEPHKFYAHLRALGAAGQDRFAAALARCLAYPNWGMRPYPKDSYPSLAAAMAIDRIAALQSCSWGLGQIMGENYKMCGFRCVEDMVEAFCDSERAQLDGMVKFIKAAHLDDALRRHDWAGFARGYNGPQYQKNDYDNRLARRFAYWKAKPDTPWTPAIAALETQEHDSFSAHVAPPLAPPPKALPERPPPAPQQAVPAAPQIVNPAPQKPASTEPASTEPAPRQSSPPAPPQKLSFWGRFKRAFLKGAA